MNVQTSLQTAAPRAANPLTYGPRACHAFGIVVDRQHTYKIYVILSDCRTLADCPPASALRRLVLQAFEGWDASEDHPVGFAILHLARDGTYVLASRWNNANNLRHRAYRIDLEGPHSVSAPGPLDDPWTIACVWELGLIKKEVDAWISTVLTRGEPSLTARMIEDYAAFQFTGEL